MFLDDRPWIGRSLRALYLGALGVWLLSEVLFGSSGEPFDWGPVGGVVYAMFILGGTLSLVSLLVALLGAVFVRLAELRLRGR